MMVTTILALPLMAELDAYVHHIMEFVGELLLIRSFSVIADNLPTVEAGCIYFMKQNLANNKYFCLTNTWLIYAMLLKQKAASCLSTRSKLRQLRHFAPHLLQVASSTTSPKTTDFNDASFLKKLAILELNGNRSKDASIATFFKLDTGSFVHKCVLVLRDYFFIAKMAIGHVMILEMTPPHKTSMLNPFHA
uniref:Uncharacterized protein n=1 Tax=Oryza meridionalis TaxID=40149 RepID=A0A0E0EM02_9ORYZ